jgi:hypothetical protein
MILAIRAGWRAAREHRPAFFRTLLREPAKRRFLLWGAWKDVGKLFLVAVVLDVVYQIIVLHWVYPVQTLIVATMLAAVPYLVIRGPINRIVTHIRLRPPSDKKGVSPHGPRAGIERSPGPDQVRTEGGTHIK